MICIVVVPDVTCCVCILTLRGDELRFACVLWLHYYPLGRFTVDDIHLLSLCSAVGVIDRLP